MNGVATVEDALALVRRLRAQYPDSSMTIILPPGVTSVERAIDLTAADSGKPGKPLVITGAAGGLSTLSGAKILAAAKDTSADLAILPSGTVPGALRSYGFGSDGLPSQPWLFQGRRLISISAWPRDRYARDVRINGSTEGMVIQAPGFPPQGAQQVLITGFWSWPWAFQAALGKVQSDGLLAAGVAAPNPVMSHPQVRILNVAGPLDPGTMFIDAGGRIHFRRYPGDAEPVELAFASQILRINGAHDVVVRGLAVEKSAGTAIRITDSSNVNIEDCFVGLARHFAIEIDASRDVVVERCVVGTTGLGGIRINGGNRTNLAPGHLAVRDSVVQDVGLIERSSRAGIAVAGVGNEISRTLIQNMPHMAITLDGNDHLVDRNEIRFVVCDTDDAGAIYMGSDWTYRGNRITRNLIHDIAPGGNAVAAMGVYLDDQFSGAYVADNALFRMPHGVMIGGGRDNLLEHNDFGEIARSAIIFDNRGESFQKNWVIPGGELRKRLDQSPYRTALWQQRYPDLFDILERSPGRPIGNLAERNHAIDSQIVWTSPTTLKLRGGNNRAVSLKKTEQRIWRSLDALGQWRFARTLFRDAQPAAVGPAASLLFAARVSAPVCRID